MKYKIFIAILISVFAALIAAMQDPFILAGGSDASEVIISPSKASQWFALFLFSVLALLPSKLLPLEKRFSMIFRSILLAISILLLLVSGHTYRYSSRAHALIDTWYFIPWQTLTVDSDNYITSAEYSTGPIFVYVSAEDKTRQTILSGPWPFGISQPELVKLLQNFGFVSQSK